MYTSWNYKFERAQCLDAMRLKEISKSEYRRRREISKLNPWTFKHIEIGKRKRAKVGN